MPADTTARLAELQSRIRPHFLFNTLNTAITLVRSTRRAPRACSKTWPSCSASRCADSGESVTLAEEVELAQRYLAIEQMRFGERLQVSWELDPAAGAARACRRCCCSRWSRTRCATASSRRRGRRRSACARAHARPRGGRRSTTACRTGRRAPATAWRWRNVRERLRLMHDVGAQFETARRQPRIGFGSSCRSGATTLNAPPAALRVLIVDDEELARAAPARLVQRVRRAARVVVGEAANAAQALAWLTPRSAATWCCSTSRCPAATAPQLAAELRHLPQPPAVVFVTAHAEHALARVRPRGGRLPDQAGAARAPAGGAAARRAAPGRRAPADGASSAGAAGDRRQRPRPRRARAAGRGALPEGRAEVRDAAHRRAQPTCSTTR